VTIQAAFDVVVILGMAWFFVWRTRPVLAALDARPNAGRLALAATAVGITAAAIHLAAALTGEIPVLVDALRLLGGLVWILVVGLGYPQYRFLRHATGTKRPGT
jgi:hypothetical protein